MYAMVKDLLGNQKVPLVLALAAFAGLVGLQKWSEVQFIPRVQAEQSMQALSSKVDKTNKLIVDHISDRDRRDINIAIEVVKDNQYSLKQYVSANGATAMTDQREEDLNRKMSNLLDIKACYNRNGKNCE